MILAEVSAPGLSMEMSQTKQQEQGVPPARARRDRELFWRIIAGLMLLVVAWVVWVLYQITPRSVVNPPAYANQGRLIGTQQSVTGAAAPAPTAGAAAQPAPDAAATDLAMDLAQAAARTGAHQASADVQAAALEKKEAQIKGEGLRLATEISTPLAEKRSSAKTREGEPDGGPAAPAATGAAANIRP